MTQSMMRRWPVVAVVAAGLVGSAAAVGCSQSRDVGAITTATAARPSSPDRWQITDLAVPGGPYSRAVAINNRGQIAAESRLPGGEWHAFLWENGKATALGAVSDRGEGARLGSQVMDLNERGEVLIAANVEGVRPVVWEKGKRTELGTLGGDAAWGVAINDDGQVVGQSMTSDPDATKNSVVHAFLWDRGKMTDLGTLGGRRSYAFALNNGGQVVGVSETRESDGVGGFILHGFLWRKGKLTDLGPVGTPAWDWPKLALNDRGQVAMTVEVAAGETVIIRWANGSAGTVAKLPYSLPEAATYLAISDRGEVTGTDVRNRLFVWEAGRTRYPTRLPGPAVAINARGQVIGNRSPDGRPAAFVWERGRSTFLGGIMNGGTPSRVSSASAMNEHDQIVGWSRPGRDDPKVVAGWRAGDVPPFHAVLWTRRQPGS